MHHHLLGPAIQAVFTPAKSARAQAMELFQKNVEGGSVKGFTNIWVE